MLYITSVLWNLIPVENKARTKIVRVKNMACTIRYEPIGIAACRARLLMTSAVPMSIMAIIAAVIAGDNLFAPFKNY